MSTWTQDDAGDLVNLDQIELIMLNKIDRGDDGAPLQEAPEGHTHEVLAVSPRQDSYRLFSGTVAECANRISYLKGVLNAI